MTEIRSRLTQSSYGDAVASTSALAQSGRLAASLFIAHLLSASPVVADGLRGRAQPVVAIPMASRTFGERSATFDEMVSVPRETSLEEFHSGLLSKQEVLGRDFERALFDNVWDLYAR